MSAPTPPWQPIADYEVDPSVLARPELAYLRRVWEDQRTSLEGSDGLRRFTARLRREWSIETGLLERIYHLDRGVTEALVERGIVASLIPHRGLGPAPEHVAAILRDHETAIELLFDFIRRDRPLSSSFIKELHALFTRNQPSTTALDARGRMVEIDLRRGEWKIQPNNPRRPDGSVHLYCPPEHVAAEMDRLLALHAGHRDVAPEVEAAWLHHRFTQIHPFQDGNGRVARALATLIFLRAASFPLVVRDTVEERNGYLDALEHADRGELGFLVRVFAAAERRCVAQAIGLSAEVAEPSRIEDVIQAAKESLERRGEPRPAWPRTIETARALLETARLRLTAIAADLERDLADVDPGLEFVVDAETGDSEARIWFRSRVDTLAKALGYSADPQTFHGWTRLQIRNGAETDILVSIHGIGRRFRGLLAASVGYFRRVPSDAASGELTGATALAAELFQINYREPAAEARARFEPWLEDALLRGLDLWRKGL